VIISLFWLAYDMRMKMWQEISSAPMDGTMILLTDGNLVEVGHYVDNSYWTEEVVSEGPKRITYEKIFHESGYWECHEVSCPTHWMAIPTLPK
jgi:hypothetical protein